LIEEIIYKSIKQKEEKEQSERKFVKDGVRLSIARSAMLFDVLHRREFSAG
jgi:hypothetical protein